MGTRRNPLRAVLIGAGTVGNLWFTEISANKIGRITTAGAHGQVMRNRGIAELTARLEEVHRRMTANGLLNLLYMSIPLSSAGTFRLHTNFTGRKYVDAGGYLV